MPSSNSSRLHPSRWPLVIWTLGSTGIAFLRVEYTLGSFSFAPAAALLCGTWLGPKRAALVQFVSTAVMVPVAIVSPEAVGPGEWSFRLGLILSALVAGVIAPADDNGANPPRAVWWTVFSVASGTALLVMVFIPRITRGTIGVYFALTFLLATAIAVFYAYKMVLEPGRVVGYFFCLLPYYIAGFIGNVIWATWNPSTATVASVPERWEEILFYSYFSHLPGELISLVVIAYVVCAVDRNGTMDGPLAIGKSR